ncbi:PREDICTED: proteoglycan 4-like [Branchiostoma belcheri]|uniref:Proteoglycan 4-like n=1 Tax=Branchiostoma belcheri TaxID=7741 RepID=A0A6P4ZA40_BRABE|nr:PREDICTED: proteoglycan 4-like [Branchiostoma belcheri]
MNSGVSPRRPPLAPKPQVPKKPAVAAVKPQPHPKPAPVTAISTKPDGTTSTHSLHKQAEVVKSTAAEERSAPTKIPEKSTESPDSIVDQVKRPEAAQNGKEASSVNSGQQKVSPTDEPITISSTSTECVTDSDRIQTSATEQQPLSPTKMSQPPVPKPRRISSELPVGASQGNSEEENNAEAALQLLENAIDKWEAGLPRETEEEEDDGGVLESEDKDKVDQVMNTKTAEVGDPGETCESPKDTVTHGDVTGSVADKSQGCLGADVANFSVEDVTSASSGQQQEQGENVNSSEEKQLDNDVTPTRSDFKKRVQERPRPVPAPRRSVKAVDVVKEEGDKGKETADVKPKEREGSRMVKPPRRPPPPPFLKQKAVSAGRTKSAPKRPESSSEEVFLPNSELDSSPVPGTAKKGPKKTHFSSTIASGIRSFFEKSPNKSKDADSKRTDKPVLHIPPPPETSPEDEEHTDKEKGTHVGSPAIKPARPSRKAPAPPRPPPFVASTSAETPETGITTPAAPSESTSEDKSPSKERLSSSGGSMPDEKSSSKERSPSLPAPFENLKEKLTMKKSSPNPDSTLSSEPKRDSFIKRKLSRSKSKGEEDRKKVVPKSTFYIPPPTEETSSEANTQSSPSQHRIPPPTSPPPKPPSATLKPTMPKTPSQPTPPENNSKESSARNSRGSYVDMNISGGSAEDIGPDVDAEYMDMDTSVKANSGENLYQNQADSTDNLYMNQEGRKNKKTR